MKYRLCITECSFSHTSLQLFSPVHCFDITATAPPPIFTCTKYQRKCSASLFLLTQCSDYYSNSSNIPFLLVQMCTPSIIWGASTSFFPLGNCPMSKNATDPILHSTEGNSIFIRPTTNHCVPLLCNCMDVYLEIGEYYNNFALLNAYANITKCFPTVDSMGAWIFTE